MEDCVTSFGEVKDDLCLLMVVYGGSPITYCLHELGLTGERCLESMLVMEDNVVSIDVFPHS